MPGAIWKNSVCSSILSHLSALIVVVVEARSHESQDGLQLELAAQLKTTLNLGFSCQAYTSRSASCPYDCQCVGVGSLDPELAREGSYQRIQISSHNLKFLVTFVITLG